MNLYDITVTNTEHKDVSLGKYKGKVLLIVNTATKCGFTPQYEGLEKLYEKYSKEGLEILDFPCNQFMSQAPGSDAEIKSFCTLNFGTKFETFSKIEVNGKNAHPLYQYLRVEQSKDYSESKKNLLSLFKKSNNIKWNFTKFLVDREGHVINRFGPSFEPEKIESFIKEVL